MHFLRVWLKKCDFEDGNHHLGHFGGNVWHPSQFPLQQFFFFFVCSAKLYGGPTCVITGTFATHNGFEQAFSHYLYYMYLFKS